MFYPNFGMKLVWQTYLLSLLWFISFYQNSLKEEQKGRERENQWRWLVFSSTDSTSQTLLGSPSASCICLLSLRAELSYKILLNVENHSGMNPSFVCILQENTVPILSVGTTPALIAGYSSHPCRRGKCLFLVLETPWRLHRRSGCGRPARMRHAQGNRER